jgi:NADH:ubiquinone oxidoreductase subunit 5 (subunit L)/multisubunit Na+/H+ antiporter MnhA subunit
VTSYLLIGFYFRKPSAAKAAVKAFWVTKFADLGLLIGLLLYAQDRELRLGRADHSRAATVSSRCCCSSR